MQFHVMRALLKKIIVTLFLFLPLVQVWANCESSLYAAGEGTLESPWQIQTASQLDNVRECLGSSHSDKYFVLTADINLGVDPWNADDGWLPIGASANRFYASFDGQGYTISNLYIDRDSTQDVGLFGYTHGARISNLYISGAEVMAKASAGILVGQARSGSVITNVHVHGTVTTTKADTNFSDAGGLTGDLYNNESAILNSSADAIVSGTGRNIGGLVGYMNAGEIQKSVAFGSVENTAGDRGYIGGLLGRSAAGSIADSFAMVSVTTGTQASGDVGAGGFIGQTGASLTISNCYSVGSVTVAGGDVGGFSGVDSGATVTNSYWDTQTSGQGSSATATGKLTDELKDVSTFNTWVFPETWQMSSSMTYGGYPILTWTQGFSQAPTSNQIANLSHLLWIAEDNTRWTSDYIQTANINAFLVRSWDGGNGWTPIGTSANKFTGTYDANGFAISDLYISRSTTDNVGLFGYIEDATISDLILRRPHVSARDYVGSLVGYADHSAQNNVIQNIQATEVNVTSTTSTSSAAGGLVGYATYTDLTDIVVSGEVRGFQRVGGIIGRLVNTSSLRDSVANVSVSSASTNSRFFGGAAGVIETGAPVVERVLALGSVSLAGASGDTADVGGLAGLVGGSAIVRNSYARGNVTGPDAATGTRGVGGFVGRAVSNAQIINSYSAGSVSTVAGELGGFLGILSNSAVVTNSFWDVTTSSLGSDGDTSDSAGGTGKSSANMKNVFTFVNGEWDFQGETFNGSANIWGINSSDNGGYPFLSWQGYVCNTAALSFTVNFKDHDDSVLKVEVLTWRSDATPPASPTRTGYTFTSWNTPYANVTANIDTVAMYTINQYTITFDSGGGSAVASITQDFGSAITAPANPTREGYDFLGWSPSLPSTMPAENLTLVAQWQLVDVVVTCDYNDCSRRIEEGNVIVALDYTESETGWSIETRRPENGSGSISYQITRTQGSEQQTCDFVSDLEGTTVNIAKNVNNQPTIEVSGTVNDTDLSVSSDADCRNTHKVKVNNIESIVTSKLAGATTQLESDGTINTSLPFTKVIENGTLRAFVKTRVDGSGVSGFERYDAAADEWQVFSSTLTSEDRFEPGHVASIEERNGRYGVVVDTTVTNTIKW